MDLIIDKPVSIGSKSDCTIVVHNNLLVRDVHVTLTRRKKDVELVTGEGVTIYIDYASYMSQKLFQGPFGGILPGRMYLDEDFSFSLYCNNECHEASRYINFHVTMDDP